MFFFFQVNLSLTQINWDCDQMCILSGSAPRVMSSNGSLFSTFDNITTIPSLTSSTNRNTNFGNSSPTLIISDHEAETAETYFNHTDVKLAVDDDAICCKEFLSSFPNVSRRFKFFVQFQPSWQTHTTTVTTYWPNRALKNVKKVQ